MKIGIHNEPSGGTAGGSECCVAVLAEALGRTYSVDLIHHRPTLTPEHLETLSGTDLSAVRCRYVPPAPGIRAYLSCPWQYFEKTRTRQAHLSEPYDLFITFTHGVPPFCHAPRGVLVVLFPFGDLAPALRWHDPWGTWFLLWSRLCSLHRNRGWEERLASYQVKLAISRFAGCWARRRWGIDCTTIYPPVGTCPRALAKDNLILSVGRFATQGHGKKQREMVAAFGQLRDAGLGGWEFYCVGGLSSLPRDRSYFEEVRRLGLSCHVQVQANVGRAQLERLYGQAKIFWHAAGYGDDDRRRPELAEHFGIATVEAMASGAVPVVVNKGAQPEIVQHGVNGLVWNTLEELKAYTHQLAHDEPLRAQMSEAACDRARSFSRENFVHSYLKVVGHLLPDPAPAKGRPS
jgi:glycosyltransferase involved in cell wall biosynthesis